MMHNEVRDLFGSFFRDAGLKSELEPPLLPLNGEKFKSPCTTESDDARCDVKAYQGE